MKLEKKSLFFASNMKTPIAEAYRALRTNVQFLIKDKNIKSIVVTSAMPSEGKTTTIANLSIAVAQSGSRVLLVDTDLRKPRIYTYFDDVNRRKGLTNILINNEPIDECIQRTSFDNLDILVTGPIPPNPSELVGSNAMINFIDAVSSQYDLILLDAPPVGLVTDAVVLSTICNGVIFVCNSGKTAIDLAKKAKQQLESVNAKILGVVLNGIKKESREYCYYNEYSESLDENGEGDYDAKASLFSSKKKWRPVFFLVPILVIILGVIGIFLSNTYNSSSKNVIESVYDNSKDVDTPAYNKKTVPTVSPNDTFKLGNKHQEDAPVKYIIQTGDTLMSVSRKFYDDQMKYEFIKEKNNLKADKLSVGSAIYIYPLE